MTTETLYEGGTILDGAGASLENHGVMVRDGRIAEVAPRDRFQGFTGFRVDFTGGTLLPVEERAKIIAELEALRAKQGGSAPKPPASQTKALTDEAAKSRPWQKPHQQNMTGTINAYRPKGHDFRGGQRAHATGDYEAWSPE